MLSQLIRPFWFSANDHAGRFIAAALAIGGLLGGSAEGFAATRPGFLGARGQSVFIEAETVNISGLDDKLALAGFPGVPDTLSGLGAVRDWQVGGSTSPLRVGVQGALAIGEGVASPKRLRVVRGYVGPHVAYLVSPAPRFMAEMVLGVGVGATVLSLIHSDAQSLQSALSQGHESTIWRASLLISPELVVGAEITGGLLVELGMGYHYDFGLGGWRTAGGNLLTDAPSEGFSGIQYRLGVSWGGQVSTQQPPPATEAVPWTTVLGFTVVSVDAPTASRLRLPDQRGAQIIHVVLGSPAARAGLRQDDVIRRVGSVDILSAQHLLEEIGSYRPGDVVPIRVWRLETVAPLIQRGRLVDLFLVLPGQ